MRPIVNPVAFANDLADDYRRYLRATFPVRQRQVEAAFDEALRRRGWLVKGPLLEGSAPFEPGGTIRDLVDEGVLHSGWQRLCRAGGPLQLDRPLYRHQEAAARAACAEPARDLVVATGTGSGKTEAFLIPIIDHLLRQRAEGALRPGVRAMLLYPMNALANDQLKRLRELLRDYPDITFGRFTGETEEDEAKAERAYREIHGEDPLPNEVLDRATLRVSPPHILLTNYSMLEYLLLRPSDSALFDGATGRNWRFIVLDEAHTYGGALGIELAMLMRRVQERVGRPGSRLTCMATSATLGGDDPAIKDFAERLFGKPAEGWEVIRGQRQGVALAPGEGHTPQAGAYLALRAVLDAEGLSWPGRVEALLSAARAAGVPAAATDAALAEAGPAAVVGELEVDDWGEHVVRPDPPAEEQRRRLGAMLFRLLDSDARVATLGRALAQSPRWLVDVMREVFPEGDDEAAIAHTHALVELAVMARLDSDGKPLLPARYHLFARALEGLFIASAAYPRPGSDAVLPLEPALERVAEVETQGRHWPVYETASCRRCGQLYFQAELVEPTIAQPHARLAPTAPVPPGGTLVTRALFAFEPVVEAEAAPDDDEAEDDDDPLLVEISLCLGCGAFRDVRAGSPACGCGAPVVPAYYRELHEATGTSPGCAHCGARRQVHGFLTSQDAPVAVLATTLYHHLPGDPAAAARGQRGDGRKLLVFSDSRQAAAYFAPFYETTYTTLLRRRLWLVALDGLAADGVLAPGLEDMVPPMIRLLRGLGYFAPGTSELDQREEAWRWVLEEFLDPDQNNSLVGQGLVRYTFQLPAPQDGRPSAETLLLREGTPLARLMPDAAERAVVWQLLADGFRRDRAIDYAQCFQGVVADRHPTFLVERLVTSRMQRSWLPKREGGTNRRLTLLEQSLGLSRADALAALGHYWELFARRGGLEPKVDGLQLPAARHWRIDRPSRVFVCSLCGRQAARVVRGRCPGGACAGTAVEREVGLSDDHYARLALHMPTTGVRALEHTAQLEAKEAADVQEQFIRGDVNLLSCSTTFEVGVDVGELQAVVMRNVPPETSNYLQRAGRAGRRADSVAVVLTFAQRRSHDLYHYQQPETMVMGTIPVPAIALGNRKILKRHLAAVVLAAFFKQHPVLFKRAGTFFVEQDPLTLLSGWLAGRPADLSERLAEIFPADLHAALGLDEAWSWATEMLRRPDEGDDPDEGPELSQLVRAHREITTTLAEIEAVKREALAVEDYGLAERLQGEAKKLLETPLVTFMSTYGVIPKYGFPVDVVPLKLLNETRLARRLDLTRDLQIAISEYAPGSEVVAGGVIWKSAGLQRMERGKSWPTREFTACRCGWYVAAFSSEAACPKCGAELRYRATFVRPERGFVTRRKERPKKVTGRRPERTWSSQVFFGGYGSQRPPEPLRLQSGPFAIATRGPAEGKLVVVNSGRGHRGFHLCRSCGYAEAAGPGKKRSHKHASPWGFDCDGALEHNVYLGNEFLTDVVELAFTGQEALSGPEAAAFHHSLLYAVLEGTSRALSIKRDDLAGCLYQGDQGTLLLLYDAVPGGAGHVKRLSGSDTTALAAVVQAAWDLTEGCTCSIDGSCYACLRNYRNQDVHGQLVRRPVRDYLAQLVPALFGAQPSVSVANSRTWLAQQLRDARQSVVVARRLEPFLPDSPAARLTGFDWYHPLAAALQQGADLVLVLEEIPERATNLATALLVNQLRMLVGLGLKLRRVKPGSPPAPWAVQLSVSLAELRLARLSGTAPLELAQRDLPRIWELALADHRDQASSELASWLEAFTSPVGPTDPLLIEGARARVIEVGEREFLLPAQVFGEFALDPWKRLTLVDPYLMNSWQLFTLGEVLAAFAPSAAPGARVVITTRAASPATTSQVAGFEQLRQRFASAFTLEVDVVSALADEDSYRRLHDRELVVDGQDGRRVTLMLGRGLSFFTWDALRTFSYTRETKIAVFEGQVERALV